MTFYRQGDRFEDLKTGENKPYSLEFSKYMLAGDQIVSAVWSSVPAGLVFADGDFQGTVAVVDISPGVVDIDYCVTCAVTSNQGHDYIADAKMLLVKAAC